MQMRITKAERDLIEFRLRLGNSRRAIARLLHRHHTVVAREIRRHQCADGIYRSVVAQAATDRQRNKEHCRKLDKDPRLREFVETKLKEYWSPQYIAGVLKSQPPSELQGKRVSHETIYHYIYRKASWHKQLYLCLRVARKHRQRRYARKKKKIMITQRISIQERPAFIAERKEIGHWEADLVEGRKQKDGYLCVRVERTTRLVQLTKLEHKTARETRAALETTIWSLPVKTITFDNGTENAEHHILAKQYGIGTFFCDAYASWQKGTVENMNKLIRQYVPKRTDALKQLTTHDVKRIEDALNNRPRKCLNYLTPNQVMQTYLQGVVH